MDSAIDDSNKNSYSTLQASTKCHVSVKGTREVLGRGVTKSGPTAAPVSSKNNAKSHGGIVTLQRVFFVFIIAVTLIETRRSQAMVTGTTTHLYYASTRSGSVSSSIQSTERGSGIQPPPIRTGIDLHLEKSACGQSWSDYLAQLPKGPRDDHSQPLQWTVAGGDEYRENADNILTKWKSLGLDPVLVIALDSDTAETICRAGFSAVHWDMPKASYSRVPDSKFAVAAGIAKKGYRGFFIEMDVFCRQNPVPMFMQYPEDLVMIGHGDLNWNVNIGVWMTSAHMSKFFQSLTKVLKHSLEHPEFKRNEDNYTVPWFDQNVFQHCLPIRASEDDDMNPTAMRYYLHDDNSQEKDILQACREFEDFNYTTIAHHVVQAHDPPTIYDSTICMHPLAGEPFSPFAFKLGVAKFYGWDPTTIRSDEKLLKTTSGDFDFASCFNRVFVHEDKKFTDHRANHVVAVAIAAMVEIAYQTNRTLILPRYLRTDEAHGVPTHAVVDVRSFGVPYRFMSIEESHTIEPDDMQVVQASPFFHETLNNVLQARYRDTKFLAMNRMCNVRDHELPIIEERKAKMSWCLDVELDWVRANGGFMDFCGGE